MVAGVVDEAGERLVGELVLADEVPAAELQRVDADLLGERVHRPLDRVGRFGPSGASVGICRREVREHPGAREVVRLGQVVHAGVQERTQDRDARRDQLEVGAHVGGESHPHGGEAAVRVGGEFDVLDLPASLDGRDGVLRAGLVPADRHAEFAGERDAQQFLGVHVELGAEPAADRRSDDAELVFGNSERDRHHDLEDVGDLRRGVQRHVTAERLGHGDDGAGLHRHRDQTLLDVAFAHGVGGLVERSLYRPVGLLDEEVPRVGRVGAELGVDDHAVRQGVFEFGDGFAGVVLDVDRLDGVVGHGIALGEYDRDAVTDVVHGVDGDRVVRRTLHVLRDGPCARHRGGPEVGEVGAGVDGSNAGHRRCRGRVDRDELARSRTGCGARPCATPPAPSCRW